MSAMNTRIRHARKLWFACGLLLAALLVVACVLMSAWQMWHFKSVLQQWHQSSVSLMAQSIAIQVDTRLQQASSEPSPTRVMRYFEQTLSQNPLVLSATLEGPQHQTWAWPLSQASTEATSSNVKVSHTLSFQSGKDWQLHLVFKKASAHEAQTAQTSYTLLACALALGVLSYLLRWLWHAQVIAPQEHWEGLSALASQGKWQSTPPQQNAHVLTQASHDAVQRVRLRTEWVRWQEAQWARQQTPVPPRRST